MYPFGKKRLRMFVPTSQKIIQVGLFTIIIPNVCVSVADVLNDFEISFLCHFESLVYVL